MIFSGPLQDMSDGFEESEGAVGRISAKSRLESRFRILKAKNSSNSYHTKSNFKLVLPLAIL